MPPGCNHFGGAEALNHQRMKPPTTIPWDPTHQTESGPHFPGVGGGFKSKGARAYLFAKIIYAIWVYVHNSVLFLLLYVFYHSMIERKVGKMGSTSSGAQDAQKLQALKVIHFGMFLGTQKWNEIKVSSNDMKIRHAYSRLSESRKQASRDSCRSTRGP